jgi:hypothetical protein
MAHVYVGHPDGLPVKILDTVAMFACCGKVHRRNGTEHGRPLRKSKRCNTDVARTGLARKSL